MNAHEPGAVAVQSSLPLGIADVIEVHNDTRASPETSAGQMPSIIEDGAAVAGGFDYDREEIPPERAADMRDTAALIRHTMNDAVIVIGGHLLRVKKQLDHGRWMRWVETEAGMSVSSAERMMGVAERAATKSSRVTNMPPTLLYVVFAKSTPPEIQDRAIARHEAGEAVSAAEVREEVRQYNEAQRKAAAEKRLTPDQRAKKAKLDKRRETERKAADEEWRQEKERRQQGADQTVVWLINQIDDLLLPRLVELIDKSDIQHSLVAKGLREHLATLTRTAHGPPPAAKAPWAKIEGDEDGLPRSPPGLDKAETAASEATGGAVDREDGRVAPATSSAT